MNGILELGNSETDLENYLICSAAIATSNLESEKRCKKVANADLQILNVVIESEE